MTTTTASKHDMICLAINSFSLPSWHLRSMPGPKDIWPGCSLLPGKPVEIPYGCNPPQGPTSCQSAAHCPQQQKYLVMWLLCDLFQELVWSGRGWTPHLPSGCQSPMWWRIPLPESPQLSKKGTKQAHCRKSDSKGTATLQTCFSPPSFS